MWGCSLRHDASDLWLGAHDAYADIPGPVGAGKPVPRPDWSGPRVAENPTDSRRRDLEPETDELADDPLTACHGRGLPAPLAVVWR